MSQTNSQIDEEEEAPTTGLNSNVVATGRPRIRITVKFSMTREVANAVNTCSEVPNMEEEKDCIEQGSPEVVTAEAMNSSNGGGAASKDGELEECGSSESKAKSGSEMPSEIYACPECPKAFPSRKALYGHMRSHPNRDYRGTNKPAPGRGVKRPAVRSPPNRTLPLSYWGVRAKRGRIVEQEAAETLVMISQVQRMSPRPIKDEKGCPQKRLRVKKEEDTETRARKGSSAGRSFQCNICYKTFTAHQALGGHMASHYKHRNRFDARTAEGTAGNVHAGRAADSNGAAVRPAAAAAEHRCQNCGDTFPTGQALGGHMRRHYVSPPVAASPQDEDVQNENPPAQEEEEEEIVENEKEEVVEDQNAAAEGNAENLSRVLIRFDLNEAPPESDEEEEIAAV